MATYVNDLRLKEIATGDESGTWGTSTNTNLELIAEAFSFGTEAITTNADTHTTTIADGSTDPGRSMFLKYTGTLDSACTITIGPNTISKLWFIENATSGSQNIIISQGSGASITIPNGHVKAIYSDGAGSGAAMVDAFTDLNLAGTTTVAGISSSGAIVPSASDGAALGSASLEWSDLFLADAAVINLGDDQDTTLTHVADTGILLNSTRQLQFGDSGTYIHQSADGVLDLVSDTEIEINATTIDINGNADVSGTVTATGTSVFASLDISGDIDVDGTTNLDVVDIDGAVDMASTLQVDGAITGSSTINGVGISSNITNFANSILISNDAGTGTLDAASNNTGFGYEVFDDLTSGDDNTAVGYQAGTKITSGHSNTLIGKSAGAAITTGSENVFVGERAGDAVTTGGNNTGVGHKALTAVTTASNNVAVGNDAGAAITTGNNNVAIGDFALDANTTASNNTAVGTYSLSVNETGANNTAIGNDTLDSCTSGSNNTAIGVDALQAVTDSTNNVGVGYLAGSGITTGGRNTCLGEGSGIAGSPSGAITTSSNIMCLGDDNMQTLFCAQSSINTSDSRDKADVTNFTGGLAWINKMNPVTYQWDRRSWYAGDKPEPKDILAATPDGSKKSSKIEIGLIAQDVLDIEKDNGYGANNDNSLLVNLTEDETRYGINYTNIIPILINSIKELSAKVEELEKG